MPASPTIPKGFYGSSFFLVTIPGLSYRNYCSARDAWLAALERPRGCRILDVGCSSGEALAPWTDDNWIVGLDREPSVLREAEGRGFAAPLVGELCALPLAENSFDVVVGLGIIGGREDPRQDYRELLRPVRPGGRLLLAVAVFGGIRLVTRPLVKLLRVRHQMVTVPTLASVERDLGELGAVIDRLAVSSLYPRPSVVFDPGPWSRRTAVYAFIEARKPGPAGAA